MNRTDALYLRSSSLPLQHGMALVVVLLLLLLMTLMGLASMRGTVLDERMSANHFSRSLAFQSAEAALRQGEALALRNPTPPLAGCDQMGLCATPESAAQVLDRWHDQNFQQWVDASAPYGSVANKAQYFVEYMGLAPSWPGCNREIGTSANCLSRRYRVTARSIAADNAQVMLQSYIAAP